MADHNQAAEDRGAWVAALEEELRGYKVRGLDDRAKQVEAAIRAAKGEPKGRKAKDSETA